MKAGSKKSWKDTIGGLGLIALGLVTSFTTTLGFFSHLALLAPIGVGFWLAFGRGPRQAPTS